MLAQYFLAAEALGITEAEHDALVRVLGMLERGEISYHEPLWGDMTPGENFIGFNMSRFYDRTECGTVACIGGWAEYVGKLPHKALVMKRRDIPALMRLFEPCCCGSDRIRPSQAALALRNYLTLGEPRWNEVLAS